MPRKAATARRIDQVPGPVASPAERPKPTRKTEAAQAFAVAAARAAAADHCDDVVVLDLRGISQVCDYFVIATGTSDRQMRAVVDHVEQLARDVNDRAFFVSGYDEGTWIVADYVDVVVHVFSDELRAYYDLDSLWGDAPKVEWNG